MTLLDLGGVQKGAVLSEDLVYRYELTRRWDDRDVVTWVMLNPSTADAELDDLTITKCCGFTRRWGWGGIKVVNLFGLRATHPTDLWTHPDPIGPRNGAHLHAAITQGQFVVVAWGATRRPSSHSVSTIQWVARSYGKPLRCLGTTKDGSPRHPSRLGYDTPLEFFGGGHDTRRED